MIDVAKRTCSVPGCEKPRDSYGFCGMHYMRWKRKGDPFAGGSPRMVGATEEERFWAKVDKNGPNGCWGWTAWKLSSGYGGFDTVRNGRKTGIVAHRYAYELLVGSIPEGLQLDHLCRNRGCVNPDHLEPVTPAENKRRGMSPHAVNARKTHCLRGHPLPAPIFLRGRWERRCEVCMQIRSRRKRAA